MKQKRLPIKVAVGKCEIEKNLWDVDIETTNGTKKLGEFITSLEEELLSCKQQIKDRDNQLKHQEELFNQKLHVVVDALQTLKEKVNIIEQREVK